MTLNAVVLPAPFGPMRPAIVPSSTARETSSSATMPPNRREACSRERRPIRKRDSTESIPDPKGLPAGEVLVPELLHRRRPWRAHVGRVVRRVVDGADDPVAVRVHVEDVDAAGRLLEAAEERPLADECPAQDRAVD